VRERLPTRFHITTTPENTSLRKLRGKNLELHYLKNTYNTFNSISFKLYKKIYL